MDKEHIELLKTKIEMLEKEANLIFKQIVVYLTILGSIIAFIIKNFSFQIDIEIKDLTYWLFLISLPLGIILGTFMTWLTNSIKRLREIKWEIEYTNKKVEKWNI